jgi:hypothetical protein
MVSTSILNASCTEKININILSQTECLTNCPAFFFGILSF